ncbi:MAG: UDP-glucose 4-epimerase GalE [Bacteroidetes bacterium]|nr:UDP-glucose 4-epimerase GalE [Bacteroidota bacterium]
MNTAHKGRILVTGGAGYIGSHTVVALLEAGYEPLLLDNFANSSPSVLERLHTLTGQSITCLEADCTQTDAVLERLRPLHVAIPFAGIIHFAAYKAVGESMARPLEYYHNNLGAMTSVLRWMEELGISLLVFSSSCTVYGQPEALPVSESAPMQPASSPYGHTKQMCEQMIGDFVRANPSCAAVLLRYFNPIGAHPSALLGELPLGRPNNLVPYLTQAAAGWIPPLTVFGTDYPTPDGTAVRDYIHVCDLARGHVQALDYLAHKPGICQAINLGASEGVSVRQLIDTFTAATGAPVPHQTGPRRAGDVAQVYADTTLATQLLGWQPQFSLADALRHAWAWQQQLPETSRP